MIIHTEANKTIGGFTHYPWKSEGGHLSDPAGKAFLFSLDLKEKYIPVDNTNLINRQKENGPLFGAGHDIYTNGKRLATGFPSSYNRERDNKLVKNQYIYIYHDYDNNKEYFHSFISLIRM